MVLAAIGQPVTLELALGPAIIYDRRNPPAKDARLAKSIVVAVFDEEDVDESGKYSTWGFEGLLDTLRGAVINIGGGGDHFTTRMWEWIVRRPSHERPAVVAGLFGRLKRGPDAGRVILGDHEVTNGTMLAVDAAKGAVYVPAKGSYRDILRAEAGRWVFFDEEDSQRGKKNHEPR